MQAPRKEFVTPKGTLLPLLNLKGKEYLQVAHRLIWFREEKPDWSITTGIVHCDDNKAIVMAIIANEKGEKKSTAHKQEHMKHFPDFMEKAETGAIGRALALCGYGTQFTADELEEGERLADSPTLAPVGTVAKRGIGLNGAAKPATPGPTATKPVSPSKPIPQAATKKAPEPDFDEFPGGPLPG